jgi:lipopolysaccharide transport protein LptA
MWQKPLRLAIALFVVVFAVVLVVSLRKGHQAARQATAPPPALGKDVVTQGGRGHVDTRNAGKGGISLTFGRQTTYADGRKKLEDGVTLEIPDKGGRSIKVESKEAELVPREGQQVGNAVFSGGVKLTTSDGIIVTSPDATYSEDEEIARIPGPVSFSKGRMTGSAVGATYDKGRNVLWLLDRAKVDVAPDKDGSGAIHVTAKTAGMARNDHYMKFQTDARLESQEQILTADEVTTFLTPDDERMTRMEMRGSAHIVGKPRGKPGGRGPQDMRAKDIDLAFAEDGRTLQSSRLVENASMQLPGDPGKSGRRIAGRTIDVTMGPDGSTVTNLAATENVQVDLPADGDTPARRIRSASLIATGAEQGIQAATFAGDVEFRESRAARGKTAAVDRTAKSARMDLKTKPGFGDIEQASFHTNVHFTDGTKTTADAPTAVYAIAQDRLDLSPGEGDTGRGPHVSDGRISVEARTISMVLGTQVLKADTRVRSTMVGSKPGGKDAAVRMPSMLKQDQPVNVTSNRLDYDGANSVAIYDGNARLWQDDTEIRGDRITVEDKTGNLRATGKVVTTMVLTEAADGTAKPKPPEPTNTTAEELLYEDQRHRATYTGKAHMSGPNGDVTAAKIELSLAEQGGQLERAEADGDVVLRQELRRAYGQHLTYNAKEGTYTMTGSPVKVFDDTPGDCRVTEGAIATFQRTGGASSVQGSAAFPHKSSAAVCGSGPGTPAAPATRTSAAKRM